MRRKKKGWVVGRGTAKMITIRVPVDLLRKMSNYRTKEGVSVTFQLTKGAELYLKEKGAWDKKED